MQQRNAPEPPPFVHAVVNGEIVVEFAAHLSEEEKARIAARLQAEFARALGEAYRAADSGPTAEVLL